jgi:quinol monooxygenase YgiN
MYAVVNHLDFTKPVDEFLDKIREDLIPMMKQSAGFIDFHLVKADELKAIVLILWEDAASAQAGAKNIGPNWFVPNIKPFLVNPEDRTTGEVVVTTSGK